MWTQRGTTAAKNALCSEGRVKNILFFLLQAVLITENFFPKSKQSQNFCLCCTKIGQKGNKSKMWDIGPVKTIQKFSFTVFWFSKSVSNPIWKPQKNI